MEYNSIRHKLNKYQNKLTLESNQYKKALYSEKVGHYRQMLQSGGTNLAQIIQDGITEVNNDLTKITEAITVKSGAVFEQDFLQTFEKNIENIQKNIGNYKDTTMEATVNFANYNINVRKNFRDVLQKINAISPLSEDDKQKIMKISTNLEKLQLKEIEENQNLVGLIGILAGNTVYENIQKDLEKVIQKKDGMAGLKIEFLKQTKDFATNVTNNLGKIINTDQFKNDKGGDVSDDNKKALILKITDALKLE